MGLGFNRVQHVSLQVDAFLHRLAASDRVPTATPSTKHHEVQRMPQILEGC